MTERRSGAAPDLVTPVVPGRRHGGVEVSPVKLEPATYACPQDHSDLSPLVLQALGGTGLEVARAWLLPPFRAR